MNKNIKQEELIRRLDRESKAHREELDYAFSVEVPLDEARMPNDGDEINMHEYFKKLNTNMPILSRKIYESMESVS